jgi:hypothetical protein
MRSRAFSWLKWAAAVFAISAVTLLAVRGFNAQRGPLLGLWHAFAQLDASEDKIDKANCKQYRTAEDRVFSEVRTEVSDRSSPLAHNEGNRHDATGSIYPGRFATEWNRSCIIMPPEGSPGGPVVRLHGLTDSPYSLRHIARCHRDDGLVAVSSRMPGQGTVPGGLSSSTGCSQTSPKSTASISAPSQPAVNAARCSSA